MKIDAKGPERDPNTITVQFNFCFLGFEAQLYTGNTPLNVEPPDEVKRDEAYSLAKLAVKKLSVKGNVYYSSAIKADVYLENLVSCSFSVAGFFFKATTPTSKFSPETYQNQHF